MLHVNNAWMRCEDAVMAGCVCSRPRPLLSSCLRRLYSTFTQSTDRCRTLISLLALLISTHSSKIRPLKKCVYAFSAVDFEILRLTKVPTRGTGPSAHNLALAKLSDFGANIHCVRYFDMQVYWWQLRDGGASISLACHVGKRSGGGCGFPAKPFMYHRCSIVVILLWLVRHHTWCKSHRFNETDTWFTA